MIAVLIVVVFLVAVIMFDKTKFFKNEIYDFGYYIRTYNIPIIPLEINRKIYYFIIDSGCTISMVDDECYQIIKHVSTNTNEDSNYVVVGIDGKENEVTLHSCLANILDKEYLIKYQTGGYDFSNLAEDIKISGLLGLDFFQRNNMIIDFKINKIYA